jgi:Tol biopolymer transport system component/DNA-binding winged helix-turn-helix (wHTH) protein
VTFGLFEADLQSAELRKSGMRIKLQGQPFEVLRMLLERHNEIVSREELRATLWGDGTTVDFDHSLGTAVNKIRQALGDVAENPRFVETIARKGYRFIAPVRVLESPATTHQVKTSIAIPLSSEVVPVGPFELDGNSGHTIVVEPVVIDAVVAPQERWRWSLRSGLTKLLAVEAVVLGLIGAGGFAVYRSAEHPVPYKLNQITYSGMLSPGAPDMESFPAMATDGPRMFVPIIRGGTAMLSQVSIADGQTTALDLPSEIAGPAIGDISPDGSKLLVRNHLEAQAEAALWVVPTLGSEARRIPNILAHDATWMPDGEHVLFGNGGSLFVAKQDGGDVKKFADVPGRAFWIRWSPDGKLVRFTSLDPLTHVTTLWEIKRDGTGLRPVLKGWNDQTGACCGTWTADGRFYVFEATRGGTTGNLWAIDNAHRWLHPDPFAVTNGPLSYRAPVASRSGHEIFFLGLNTRINLLRYDAGTRAFKPLRRDSSTMGRTEFSRDGQWIAWINQADGTLWRSRTDGSERLQLTTAPMQVFRMHWSPDDKQIAVMGRMPGEPWKVSILSVSGGTSQLLLTENRNEADPDFSPDGKNLVIGRLPELMAIEKLPKTIFTVDVASRKAYTLPGSDGLFSPRWSPDGRFIAALPLDQSGVRLYDTVARTWRTLAARSAADPAWSHDGKWIFFHAFAEAGTPIYKVNVGTGELVRVTGLGDLDGTDIVDYFFSGLTQDDSPIVTARMSTANFYSLDLDGK